MQFDNKSIKILRCISQHGSLDVSGLIIYTPFELDDINKRISYLSSNKLIEMDDQENFSQGIDMFRLTLSGEIALENESKYRRNSKFNEFRAWVTLLIAIIALILSIIK